MLTKPLLTLYPVNDLTCRIADLSVGIPATGEMSSRCRKYLAESTCRNVVLREADYRLDSWPNLSYADAVYLESGMQFYISLLHFNGLMLHASAVALGGRAYLFSGPCGRGKSTHTRLWQDVFGECAQVFNDDKPALRRLDGRWYAYGTPWCGKDGINLNQKWPLGGICFLEQARENRIRLLNAAEALPYFMAQTIYQLWPHEMDMLLASLDKLLQEVPVFLLENRPEEAAVRLSYETMRRAAEEEGL